MDLEEIDLSDSFETSSNSSSEQRIIYPPDHANHDHFFVNSSSSSSSSSEEDKEVLAEGKPAACPVEADQTAFRQDNELQSRPQDTQIRLITEIVSAKIAGFLLPQSSSGSQDVVEALSQGLPAAALVSVSQSPSEPQSGTVEVPTAAAVQPNGDDASCKNSSSSTLDKLPGLPTGEPSAEDPNANTIALSRRETKEIMDRVVAEESNDNDESLEDRSSGNCDDSSQQNSVVIGHDEANAVEDLPTFGPQIVESDFSGALYITAISRGSSGEEADTTGNECFRDCSSHQIDVEPAVVENPFYEDEDRNRSRDEDDRSAGSEVVESTFYEDEDRDRRRDSLNESDCSPMSKLPRLSTLSTSLDGLFEPSPEQQSMLSSDDDDVSSTTTETPPNELMVADFSSSSGQDTDSSIEALDWQCVDTDQNDLTETVLGKTRCDEENEENEVTPPPTTESFESSIFFGAHERNIKFCGVYVLPASYSIVSHGLSFIALLKYHGTYAGLLLGGMAISRQIADQFLPPMICVVAAMVGMFCLTLEDYGSALVWLGLLAGSFNEIDSTLLGMVRDDESSELLQWKVLKVSKTFAYLVSGILYGLGGTRVFASVSLVILALQLTCLVYCSFWGTRSEKTDNIPEGGQGIGTDSDFLDSNENSPCTLTQVSLRSMIHPDQDLSTIEEGNATEEDDNEQPSTNDANSKLPWIREFGGIVLLLVSILGGLVFGTANLKLHKEYNVHIPWIGAVYTVAAGLGSATSFFSFDRLRERHFPKQYYFLLFGITYLSLAAALPFATAHIIGISLLNVPLGILYQCVLFENKGCLFQPGAVAKRVAGPVTLLIAPFLYDTLPQLPNVVATVICFLTAIIIVFGFERSDESVEMQDAALVDVVASRRRFMYEKSLV